MRIANHWRSLAAHPEFVEQMDNLLAGSGSSKGAEADPSPSSPPEIAE